MAEALKSIGQDRQRTNILRRGEQHAIAWLVQRIPLWMTSNTLTAIGLIGNMMVAGCFVLATYFSRYWLLLSGIGFFISWFGDSLDGRLAYYRKRPRKWYGFSLDILVDWIGIMLIGLGYIFYADETWKILGFIFVSLYAGEMIISQLRYKVTDKYSIDSGIFGPTEVRIILTLLICLETFVDGAIHYIGLSISVILLIAFCIDFRKLLRMADDRDKKENAAKGIYF
ncbi:CDP-alcohol phosphatidyltransferase family protein [Porphyromonas pogonae]|uniref:CDP-alcohol phosphatidyltransferase family protein n=1 Tax=Porphyromonas pogonae TaxID=867595 RepID=UPI002E75D2C0|nr:CDP-alcohol phosphatidyltransferase family protein [Porphyromonas pogonae]